ncbi:MAG: DnaB-like helicase C-terminal domain-containing protein [Pseudomonadota bacterium]
MYREAVYSQDEAGGSSTGAAELKIAKQRNGPTGKLSLTYIGEYTKFEDTAAES